MTTVFPTFGTITDMEGMDAATKGQALHEHKAWKCQHQSELLNEHSSSWSTNGFSSLHYKGMKREIYINTYILVSAT
jgi:hypothetical protein